MPSRVQKPYQFANTPGFYSELTHVLNSKQSQSDFELIAHYRRCVWEYLPNLSPLASRRDGSLEYTTALSVTSDQNSKRFTMSRAL